MKIRALIGPALMGLLIASFVGSACGGDTVKSRCASRGKTMTPTAQPPLAEMTLIGVHYERPPLARLTLDVRLHNARAEPRWFILPDRIAIPPLPIKTGVDGAEVSVLGGQGQVFVARFSGTGRFQAILLPGKAEVTLRAFPITFRGELPKRTLPVEVSTASRLQINGEAAETWVGPHFLSDSKADVSADDRKTVHAREMPGHQEAPVVMEQDQHIIVNVNIQKRESASTEQKP